MGICGEVGNSIRIKVDISGMGEIIKDFLGAHVGEGALSGWGGAYCVEVE